MTKPVKEDSNEYKLKALRDATQKELDRVDQLIAMRDRERQEYKTLMERLTTLPQKLQHHIMVPFGKVGFMPGRIVRTNEVMMLVGDNYFVERSCYDANNALDRRLALVNKSIDECKAEKDLINKQLEFAARLFAGVSNPGEDREVEIREEYDEKKEEEFRRLRRVQKPSAQQPAPISTDEDLMKRLDELELLENEQGELKADVQEEPVPPVDADPPRGVNIDDYNRLLQRLRDQESTSEDDGTDSGTENDNELDSDDATDEELPLAQNAVQERSTKRETDSPSSSAKKGVRFAEKLENVKVMNEEIVCEASSSAVVPDVEPTSILRNAGSSGPVDEGAVAVMKAREGPRVLPGSTDVFSGVVVERRPVDTVTIQDDQMPGTSGSDEPKRVSKFKQRRMK